MSEIGVDETCNRDVLRFSLFFFTIFVLRSHHIIFLFFKLYLSVSVWGIAAHDPSTSLWFSEQDISRLDAVDCVSNTLSVQVGGTVCFTGLVGG